VNSYGQIEPQAKPEAIETLSEVTKLAARQGLRDEVETLLFRVHLIGRQTAGTSCKRPRPPVPA
jgi:hypothetical protein